MKRRIRAKAAHALYIHCSCHRLQLASVQAAQSVGVLKRMFGTMTNLWKLFHYSPNKAEALKHVQAVLTLPELKVTTVEPLIAAHIAPLRLWTRRSWKKFPQSGKFSNGFL